MVTRIDRRHINANGSEARAGPHPHFDRREKEAWPIWGTVKTDQI